MLRLDGTPKGLIALTSFIVNYWRKDEDKAWALKDRLCQLYEGIPIHMIKDDPPSKTRHTIGGWVERYLSLETNGVVFKIDPDTEPISKADLDESGVFCAVKRYDLKGYIHEIPHAAAIGFSLPEREAILSSSMLRGDRYVGSSYYQAREELVLKDVLARLGIPIKHRADFACGTRNPRRADSTFYHR